MSLSQLSGVLIDGGFSLLLSFGLPVMFVLFVLKGAIIGKILPTSIFLPGYILAISTSLRTIVLAIAIAAAGYVCGQLLVYAIARQYGLEVVRSVPWLTITDEQLKRADGLFDRYGGQGVFVTNLVPYLGSFLCIPAGSTSYPVGRLTAYALSSTLINYVFVVTVVVGSVEVLTPL